MTPMTNMTKLLKSALVLTALATMAGCTVVPPQMAYTGPRVEVVRPAPYPYYPPASYQPRIEIVRPVPYPYTRRRRMDITSRVANIAGTGTGTGTDLDTGMQSGTGAAPASEHQHGGKLRDLLRTPGTCNGHEAILLRQPTI